MSTYDYASPCDVCGRLAHIASLVREVRPGGGHRLVHSWCVSPGGRAEDLAARVARDRAAYAGGPRAVEVGRG